MADLSEYDSSVMKAQVKADAVKAGKDLESEVKYDIGYNDYDSNETVPIRVETVRQMRKQMHDDPIAHAFIDVAVKFNDDPRIVLGALRELSKRVAPILSVDDTFSILIKRYDPSADEKEKGET